tara:strand:+ start:4530 stop:6068 length:1539 start_codon:yes stop_codon:yes gene_type:complete
MANKRVKFELTAVDKTKAAFDKVTRNLKNVSGAAKGTAKFIGGVGLAATGTAIALGAVINKSFQYIDTLGKTASRTGIATDTLQAFQLAATESGSSVEQTQKGLEKFARSIGDANRGLKTQKDIFNDLGVELKNNDGTLRSFEDILQQTADGLVGLGTEAERATALANLFGRAGLQFSEVFRDGAEGLLEFTNRANRLGLILSENTIRAVEKFNDTVSVIKLQVGALVNQILAAFVPAFQTFAEEIGNFITKTGESVGGFEALGKSIAISVVKTLQTAVLGMIEFANAIKMISTLGFGKPIFDEENIKSVENSFGKIIELVEKGNPEVNKFFENFTKGLNNQLDPLDKFIIQLKDVETTINNIAVNSMKKFEDAIINSLRSGKASFQDFANFVVEQLLRVAIQQAIIAPFTERFGGAFTNFGKKLFDFDGGGYTGMGARTGGIDGKGGFPAILHPNETVIDHSKGQGMGATVNFNINTVDAAGFDQLLVSRKGLLTQIINNAMNNQGKMGIV